MSSVSKSTSGKKDVKKHHDHHMKNSSDTKSQVTQEQLRIASMITDKTDLNELQVKVDKIIELTGASPDDAVVALHDCDNELDKAIDMILEGDISNEAEWQSTGKKRRPKTAINQASTATENEVKTYSNEEKKNHSPRGRGGPRFQRAGKSNWKPRGESKECDNVENIAPGELGARDGQRRGDSRRGRGGRGTRGNYKADKSKGTRTFSNRGYRESGSGGNFVNSIDTWTNSTAETSEPTMKVGNWSDFAGNEDWSEEDCDANLMETKVFTPSKISEKDENEGVSSSVTSGTVGSISKISGPTSGSSLEATSGSAIANSTTGSSCKVTSTISGSGISGNNSMGLFGVKEDRSTLLSLQPPTYSQYTKANESIKSLVGLNNYEKGKRRVSRIPESAVEMPCPEVITSLNVQFGALPFDGLGRDDIGDRMTRSIESLGREINRGQIDSSGRENLSNSSRENITPSNISSSNINRDRTSGNITTSISRGQELTTGGVGSTSLGSAQISRDMERTSISRDNIGATNIAGSNMPREGIARENSSREAMSRENVSSTNISSSNISRDTLSRENMASSNISSSNISREIGSSGNMGGMTMTGLNTSGLGATGINEINDRKYKMGGEHNKYGDYSATSASYTNTNYGAGVHSNYLGRKDDKYELGQVGLAANSTVTTNVLKNSLAATGKGMPSLPNLMSTQYIMSQPMPFYQLCDFAFSPNAVPSEIKYTRPDIGDIPNQPSNAHLTVPGGLPNSPSPLLSSGPSSGVSQSSTHTHSTHGTTHGQTAQGTTGIGQGGIGQASGLANQQAQTGLQQAGIQQVGMTQASFPQAGMQQAGLTQAALQNQPQAHNHGIYGSFSPSYGFIYTGLQLTQSPVAYAPPAIQGFTMAGGGNGYGVSGANNKFAYSYEDGFKYNKGDYSKHSALNKNYDKSGFQTSATPHFNMGGSNSGSGMGSSYHGGSGSQYIPIIPSQGSVLHGMDTQSPRNGANVKQSNPTKYCNWQIHGSG